MAKKPPKVCPVCKGTKTIDLDGNPVSRMGLACPKCIAAAHRRYRKGRLYLVIVYGDVDPEIAGPFRTIDQQDRAALRAKQEDEDGENGIYALMVDKRGRPYINGYAGGFMELAKKK